MAMELVLDEAQRCQVFNQQRSTKNWWISLWIWNWHTHQILEVKSLTCMIIQCSMSLEVNSKNATSISFTMQILHIIPRLHSVEPKDKALGSILEARWDQVTELFYMDRYRKLMTFKMVIPNHLIIGIWQRWPLQKTSRIITLLSMICNSWDNNSIMTRISETNSSIDLDC